MIPPKGQVENVIFDADATDTFESPLCKNINGLAKYLNISTTTG